MIAGTITLTEPQILALKRHGTAGKTFRESCKAIGKDFHAVRAAITRQGLDWDMKHYFKYLQIDVENGIRGYERIGVRELQQQPPEVPDNTPAQWLARPWRIAS